MPELSLRLLGPPLVELDGRPVHIGRHKALALLAYLALTRHTHSRDALATLLWPDLDQRRARAELRRTLSLINRTLGSQWFAIDRDTAGWDPDAKAWIDVDVLRQRLAACERHGHVADEACPDCVPLLTEAVDLYRDGFLTGFTLPDAPAFDEWQFFETESLRDAVAGALQRLARWHGKREEYETAIPYARRWLALDPLHEPAHRELMHLYARSDQRAAALRQYAECERVLAEELGIAPDAETTTLYESIRTRQELPISDDVAEISPREPSAPRRHDLPAQLTPFVGRERELADLDRLLTDPEVRLVTVLGPGGIGKTRLALEVAAQQVDRYAHGVWFVPLAPVQSVEAIVPTVVQALGASFFGGDPPEQQLLRYLRDRRLLLVLDNLEHLLAGVDLIIALLRAAPGVRVMATSRARLNLRGEQVFTLGGMDYSETAAEPPRPDVLRRQSSVILFLHSARRAASGFALSEENLPHVARVCRLAQGMPLAILLAAAWVPVLSPAEIAAEMERGLDILAADWRDEPERHHSMRAVFDATWAMLTEPERRAFARLSVFRGGFTREAAQAVAETDLRTLISLVHKSLVQRDRTGRYQAHELLRQYGESKLDEHPEEKEHALNLHCAYYAELLDRKKTEIDRGYHREMLPELDNIRAAWQHAVAHRLVAKLSIFLDSLAWLYYHQGLSREASVALGQAVDAVRSRNAVSFSGEAATVLGNLLARQGFHAFHCGHMTQATQLFCESEEILRDLGEQEGLAEVLVRRAVCGAVDSDVEAEQLLQEALAIWRKSNKQTRIPLALNTLGEQAIHRGAYH